MKYKITHKSSYTFDSEVFFEPHTLRFRPRNSPYQKLETFNLKVLPTPIGQSKQMDFENNVLDFLWFEGLHSKLEIVAESLVTISDHNPFSFLVYPATFNTIPFKYSAHLTNSLRPALAYKELSNSLLNYGKSFIKLANAQTLQFLTLITQAIHKDFSLIYRPEGEPFSPDKTFKLKEGSCRDLSWMQLQLLRALGFATRFVSGYFYVPLEKPDYELHGWIEVFIPGAGWLGYDPSHGLVVHNNHIPLIAAAHYKDTMPVSGTIRGEASSILTAQLIIEQFD